MPPFLSPLTHDQHAQLGRIAVLWGYVDMYLDNLLDVTLGITPAQRMALIGDKQMGGKLDTLSSHIDMIADAEARRLTWQFWNLCNETKTQRNKAFHGSWGWYARSLTSVTPASMHHKSREQPVKSSELIALERKLCYTASIGNQALGFFKGYLRYEGAGRLFHGPAGSPPEWLSEWTEQHPVDDQLLDRRWKLGQLPYLTHPLK